ncbi:MAG: undecaprenyldiphospho-muramoylpentapeptide beta-N-acetylglucosaminyltransferase [Cellvibrionales bacterium TMED49]|nr:undecaprenyldiphospho-muramoylpentapeptide beta-N-acetylglucosaminyltransferase [Porticoccaceae bacterium]OUU38852.1 MAG: undecaprenyldiphospho-muramoylpentapeptide beta-N-acetylglucosaminyltransferase [Cellvibrionales bacterium TMED49]
MHDIVEPRILIMAGGTGGHVFPGLAVALELRELGVEVSWLGTKKGIESELIPTHNIPIEFLNVEGVRGRGLVALIKAPFLLWQSVRQAVTIINQIKPAAVLGMGGFGSGPGALAAWLKGIPIIIHEQNAVAGTTNRIISYFARSILEGFPGTIKGAHWSGNPIRKEILGIKEPGLRFQGRQGSVNLLVLGGSRGAKTINELVPGALALIPKNNRPNVLHQTGKQHAELTRAVYAAVNVECEVVPFIDAMDEAYEWADFVICRAGALTIAELANVGLAAIFIPFPFAIDDHQTANAKWIESLRGAVVCPQGELSQDKLRNLIVEFVESSDKRLRMALAARSGAKTRATEEICKVCLGYLNV